MSICWTRFIDQHLLAAPLAHTPARDGDEWIRRPSSPPRWRSVGLLSVVADFRRVSSAGWPRRSPKAVRRQPAVFSHQEQMTRLGHVVSAVQGELLHKHPSLPTR